MANEFAGFDLEALVAAPAAAISRRGAVILTADGAIEAVGLEDAALRLTLETHTVINAPLAARRLGLADLPARDVLELFAFVRPARFAVPTASGLAGALELADAGPTLEDEARLTLRAAERLLAELKAPDYGSAAGAATIARDMAAAGWPWGSLVTSALAEVEEEAGTPALDAWRRLGEWRDTAPGAAAPGNDAVPPEQAEDRLRALLGRNAESRSGQADYARTVADSVFGQANDSGAALCLAEAGTGIGKTLGYIAPASLWAECNGGAVWLATFTKNLQRQLDQELDRLYPDPATKKRRAVVRKGRENYLCLLNYEEALGASGTGRRGAAQAQGRILLGLVARWIGASRDGDMVGGDLPAWLAARFGAWRIAELTDRRGECLYSACAHYRKCFVEKAARQARSAHLVIANHALVMAHAARGRPDEMAARRIVFDEGHHLFDAADSAFSLHLTGAEGAELRRWLRGRETGGRGRGRGLRSRIGDLIQDDDEAVGHLAQTVDAAAELAGPGWLKRVSLANAQGAMETFLMALRAHVYARAGEVRSGHGIEVGVADPSVELIEAAEAFSAALDKLHRPMLALGAMLEKILKDEDELEVGIRGRLESAIRGLGLRAELIAGWRGMLEAIGASAPEELVDWFAVDKREGRETNLGMHRHWIDPTEPFAATVLEEADGVLITSATLRDAAGQSSAEPGEDDWRSADVRCGSHYLAMPPKRLRIPSPFDYAGQTRVLVVRDVPKNDPAQVALAYEALIKVAGGGALGLFTAIARLKAVYAAIAGDLDAAGLPLYAQHVDPLDVGTLVDIFRHERHASVLGTDAMRDGVDVPGAALRLIVFDRVPWPRPTILHRARRARFGGQAYDDLLTRLRLKQAYGRLVRRADDCGVFVLLDSALPSRLATAFPEGVTVERVPLAVALETVCGFFAAPS